MTYSPFRVYKVGREKLFLDHLEEGAASANDPNIDLQDVRDEFKRLMRSEGVDHNSLAVEKGDAMENSVKSMADELGELEPEYYFIIYKRTSDVIHGNWRVVEKYPTSSEDRGKRDTSLRR